MKKYRFVLLISLLIFSGLCAKGQEQFFYSGKINLNQLILQLSEKGDSSIKANNFLLAEKYLIKACGYTDTLILCFKNSEEVKNQRINFSGKKINKFVFSYEKLGTLYMMAGNLNKAEESFNKSLMQRESIFGRRSVFRVYPYIHLGQLYFQSGNFDKALKYFSEGSSLIDRATTSGVNFDVLRYQLYGLHFETSLQRKRFKEAQKYLHRYYYALNTLSPTYEQVAAALEMKGRYFLITGDLVQAEVYIHKAEQKLPANHDIFSLAEIKILRTKALYCWKMNLRDSAATVFEKLLNSYERNIRRNFPSMSEYEREQFYITLKADFDLFNSFVASELSLNKNNSRLLEILYNTQLFTKALLLNEITKTKKNILASEDKNLILKFNEWEQAKNRIAYLHYNNKKATGEIDLLEQRINSLEKEINEKSSFFIKSNEEVRWQQIRDVLKEGEAAIEIIRAKSFNHNPVSDTSKGTGFSFTDSVNYIFLIVRPGANVPEGFILRSGKELEGKYLSFYRNSIRQRTSDNLSYDQFWKPISDRLRNCTQLYLSADGVYNQMNLNVLQKPESGQYVLDEINLVFVTNTKDLLLHKNLNVRSTARLYGHPSYSQRDKQKIISPGDSSILNPPGNGNLFNVTQQKFVDLPGTEKEIENIARIFNSNNWKTDIFLNEAATEESLKSINSAGVLHIATHGFFLADEGQHVNSMIRSGIVLSGVNDHSDNSSEDGILTAYEATSVSLSNSQLVVLSACETGLGEIKNGEGVYGLQRGLKVAGANNILMSLWKVDDDATAQLMTDFYKAWLGGTEIHTAFKQSQLSLRKKFQSPIYWGAFILLGN
jgi:CHAT domain-containing protein/tetratricopeptide (TPR) repeat protein